MKSFACIILALLATSTALAKDTVFVTTKPVANKAAVTPDAALGYILLRSDKAASMHLMSEPSAEDQAAYDKLRAAAFEKEKKRFPAKMARYKADLALYERLKKTDKRAKKPETPIAPTEESFVYPAFGLSAGASIGPMNRFAKGASDASVYLQSITPGTYRIYGLMTVLPDAPVTGPCFCMGSVKFTVRAGEVVDLGQLSGETLVPAAAGAAIDPRLSGWTVRPADLRAVGKLPNYFGATLSRINAIPGVIGYDRDRILDLSAPAHRTVTQSAPVAAGAPPVRPAS